MKVIIVFGKRKSKRSTLGMIILKSYLQSRRMFRKSSVTIIQETCFMMIRKRVNMKALYKRSITFSVQRWWYTRSSTIGVYGSSIKCTLLQPAISCTSRSLARNSFAGGSSTSEGIAESLSICRQVEGHDLSGKARRECFSRRWFLRCNDAEELYGQLGRILILNDLYR